MRRSTRKMRTTQCHNERAYVNEDEDEDTGERRSLVKEVYPSAQQRQQQRAAARAEQSARTSRSSYPRGPPLPPSPTESEAQHYFNSRSTESSGASGGANVYGSCNSTKNA